MIGLGALSTAGTFLKNFSVPCLYIAIASFLAGAGVATWATIKIKDGEVARAELALSNFRAELATQSATITEDARKREGAARDTIRDRDQSITTAIDGIPAQIAKAMAPQFAALRSSINAPQYDCIRTVPLPEPYLDRLRRPAASALETGSH